MYTTKTKCILRWALVFLIMAGIFFFSAQEGETSKAQTKEVLSLAKIEKVTKSSGALSTEAVIVRKTGHFIEYALLGIFVYLAVSSHTGNYKKNLLISFIICFLYAISDEVHQMFIPGRDPTIEDVCLDALSAFCALAVLSWISHKKEKKRRIT